MWGDPAFIRERLGDAVRDLTFDRGTMLLPALSLAHYRTLMEETAGPFIRIVQALQGEPAKLAAFRSEVEATAAPYYHDNVVKQDFLMTRATKA